MNAVIGHKHAPHRYRVTVEPRVNITGEALEIEETTTEIEVRARTRWTAMEQAEQAGYRVLTCHLIAD